MMLRSILSVATVSTLMAAPSHANGLRGSYVGPGVDVGLNGQGAAASLVGRLALSNSPVTASIRPQVNLAESVEGAIGATLDLPVGGTTNLYIGGGVALRDELSTGILTQMDDTVGYVQVGAEYGVASNVALYLDAKVALSDEARVVPTVGMAYRF